MKYAFFPGCVSRGACPELMQSLTAVAEHIGMELELMETASCTGAGVINERNQKLADALERAQLCTRGADRAPAHEYLQHVSGRYEQRQ